MKHLFIAVAIFSLGCKNMTSTHLERKAGLMKVCPTCTFVESQNEYYATDTSRQPNIFYKVRFKSGGFFYKASDVDNLIRVN